MRRGCDYPELPRDAAANQISRASLAVIVIGFNVARWLAPCLDSVLGQTLRPDEVVFVDDASTDATLAVAHQFASEGVKVIPRRVNGGMCAARMTGVEATRSTLLLFVDADNTLPPDFLRTMAEDLGDHAFVYPAKQFFGTPKCLQWHRDGRWTPRDADRARLWEENYADTCSLMRRSALLAAGGWRNNDADTMQDWSLALRMTRAGTHARSRAVLNYRVHAANWSSRERSMDKTALYAAVRRDAALITVATVYSGRMPGLWWEWLRAVKESLHAANRQAELIVVDASPAGRLDVDRSGPFCAVQVRRAALPADAVERRLDRAATSEFLAGAFNEVLRAATGDVLWTIEDDVIVPPHACRELLEELMGRRTVRAAVGGAYHSRHHPTQWVAATLRGERVEHWTELPADPAPVQLTGTGCLMVLKERLGGLRWAAEWNHAGLRSPAHDWTLSWKLHERGDPVILVPAVTCRHYLDELLFV